MCRGVRRGMPRTKSVALVPWFCPYCVMRVILLPHPGTQSEAAQQAALRLGPYMKNVPTTLVGLGAAGRRVLSAGQQGRATLKVSEARRKLGSGQTQGQVSARRA